MSRKRTVPSRSTIMQFTLRTLQDDALDFVDGGLQRSADVGGEAGVAKQTRWDHNSKSIGYDVPIWSVAVEHSHQLHSTNNGQRTLCKAHRTSAQYTLPSHQRARLRILCHQNCVLIRLIWNVWPITCTYGTKHHPKFVLARQKDLVFSCSPCSEIPANVATENAGA